MEGVRSDGGGQIRFSVFGGSQGVRPVDAGGSSGDNGSDQESLVSEDPWCQYSFWGGPSGGLLFGADENARC
jgi:hypothetical protein